MKKLKLFALAFAAIGWVNAVATTIKVDLALQRNSTPVLPENVTLIGDNYSAGSFDGSGYKINNDNNSVGLNVKQTNEVITAVSFEGYINTNDQTKNWGIAFSTNGNDWTEITMANTGTKNYHELTVPSESIPEGVIAVKIIRKAGVTTYVRKITLTTEALTATTPVTSVSLDGAEMAYVGRPTIITAKTDVTATKYKWLVNGVEQSGETTKTFVFTPTEAKTYAIICQARNEYNESGKWVISDELKITPLNVVFMWGDMTQTNKPKPIFGTLKGLTIDEYTSVKIQTNTTTVYGLKCGNSLTYSSNTLDKCYKIEAEGGFKAGDIVTYNHVYNNSSDNEVSIVLASPEKGKIYEGTASVNGRSVNGYTTDTYTLTEDAEYLALGRSGGTSNFILYIQVVRPASAGGEEPVETPVKLVTISGDTEGYVGLPVTFTATAEPAATEYQWFVGEDKQEENTATFTFTPSEIKDYTIKCQARNKDNGEEEWIESTPHTYRAAKLCGELIHYELVANTSKGVEKTLTAGVNGILGGKAYQKTENSTKGVGEKGYKLGSPDYYVSLTLASGEFLPGDEVLVYAVPEKDDVNVKSELYISSDVNNTEIIGFATGLTNETSKPARIMLTKRAKTIYLARSGEYETTQNPVVQYIAVERSCDESVQLSVSPTEVTLNATAAEPTVSATVTISGKNFKPNTYNLTTIPQVAGLTITPDYVTVGADGVFSEIVTFSYTGETNVAATSTTIDLSIGSLTGHITVNYSADMVRYYATSLNIEQRVLDNGKGYDIAGAFAKHNLDAGFTFDNNNALDSLDDADGKTARNYAFLGLKLKTSGATIGLWLEQGRTLNVRFGNMGADVKVSGAGEEKTLTADKYANIDNDADNNVYTYTADDADAYVLFTTTGSGTVVFKQIMIDDDIEDVILPGQDDTTEDEFVVFDETRTNLAGMYGTYCYEYTATEYTGATFYDVAYKLENGIEFAEVEGELQAGKPYLFFAKDNTIMVKWNKEKYVTEAVSAEEANGMIGNLSEYDMPIQNNGSNYILSGTQLALCLDGNVVPQHRAYFDLDKVPTKTPEAEAKIAGRPRLVISSSNVTTGVSNMKADGAMINKKMLIDGMLYIMREGQMYDATGRLVK